MYFLDHNPPHFHARYAGNKIAIDIKTGKIIEGKMPDKELRFIEKWREINKEKLLNNWDYVQNKIAPQPIQPLE